MNKCWTVLAIMLATAGCASGPSRDDQSPEDTLNAIQAALKPGQSGKSKQAETDGSDQPPESLSETLMPKYRGNLPAGEPPAVEERFDIHVNRIDARTFFMSLVKDTPVNVVVHPEVKGRISLDLKGVTVEEVLEVTRDVYGYEYQRNRAGFYILPARLQSRIFNVSYLNVSRKGESNTRVTSGQLSDTTDNRNGRDSRGSDGNSGGRGGRSGRNQAVSSSRVETKSEADFWSDLQSTLTTLIGGGDGRSVVVNPQSGIVVVRAMPGELRDVANFLDSAQSNLHRQVIIEAKVIEVQLNDKHQAGVNWAKLDEQGSRIKFSNQFELNDGQSEFVDSSGNFLTGALTGTKQLSGFGNLFAAGAASDDFALILRLLDQQGNVNVLSSPRVSTVNNQKAVIKVGSDEFFVTEVSSTTTTGTTTTTTPEIILTPFFSGIALDVTPQINDEGQVILHIHPTISEVTDQVKDITVAGQDQSLPLAFSTVRESDSIVRAQNGQVIVIGGLMQNRESDNESGVPGLSKIPLLGRLFKQTRRESRRSELVILLKPIVIGADGQQWESELSDVSNRIQRFGQ